MFSLRVTIQSSCFMLFRNTRAKTMEWRGWRGAGVKGVAAGSDAAKVEPQVPEKELGTAML